MCCLVCVAWGCHPLCRRCAATLRAGGDRRLRCGLLVRSPLHHSGAARVLVHRLKYQGLRAAAGPLAAAMATALPDEAAALVPIPRVLARRWRYGVDAADDLAAALARITALPVLRLLRPGWWAPAQARRDRWHRFLPRLALVDDPPARAVLVDDVITTGATLTAAATVVGGAGVVAVTATSAGIVTSL